MNDTPQAAAAAVEILIAEDSATQAHRLRHILERHGYRVVVAANGELALDAARRRKPALIISDVVMPDMDGYQLCSAVKADLALKDIPFILVTALTDSNDVIRGLECGAENFILKPYEEDFLIGRVQFALVNRGALRVEQAGMPTEIIFEGKPRSITAGRAQILNLLMSIYDAAMRRNKELAQAEVELRAINKSLDGANQRLQQEIHERDRVEQALRASEANLNELNANLDRLVTERTEELREATRRHVTLLGNLQGLAFRCRNDRGRTMEFVSEGCRELLGISPTDLESGRIVYGSLIHPEEGDRIWLKAQSDLTEHAPSDYEYRVRHADGSWRWVWERSQGIYSDSGAVVAIEGFITDVTARLKLDQQLREAQRMDAIGRLAGGLAHDLNNYLAVIVGNLDLLADRRHVDPDSPALIASAVGGALRGAELTRGLLAFSRRLPLDPQLADAGQRVGETVKLLKRTMSERISVEFDVSPGLWPVEIDDAQLGSCIVSLAHNARDAMPDGGTLKIAVRNVAAGGSDGLPGDGVAIEIDDSGLGMSAETMARAFDPFFSTKGPGHGTGLGLSMVHGFVHQSGGIIRMMSVPGQGTRVRIWLPRAAGSGVAAPAPPKSLTTGGGSESILVVEDNEDVRSTAVGQLSSLGYSVIEADTGDAALVRLERGGDHVDLVFTDLTMPGRLDGRELAGIVLARWPDMKVLLTSGIFGDLAGEGEEHTRGLTMLRKPYRKVELARAVRAALTGTDAEALDTADRW